MTCACTCGSMLTAFFNSEAVRDYAGARRSDAAAYARWFHRLLERGVSMPPSQFEAAFLSTAHDEESLASFETAVAGSFKA